MKTIKGDLIQLALAGEFDAIVHGCNCQVMMGAGIAAQIARTFPAAFEADKAWDHRVGDRFNKLGTVSSCIVKQYNDPENLTKQTSQFEIFNAYTQYHGGRNLSYSALRMCLEKINQFCKGKKVGLPLIGCGIAGGDWDSVQIIIRKYLKDCDVTVVFYDPTPKHKQIPNEEG